MTFFKPPGTANAIGGLSNGTNAEAANFPTGAGRFHDEWGAPSLTPNATRDNPFCCPASESLYDDE